MLISRYVRAAYPAVAVESVEDARVLSQVVAEVSALAERSGEDWTVASIAATGTLRTVWPEVAEVGKRTGYPDAYAWAASRAGRVALVVYDVQHMIANPGAYRALKDHFGALSSRGSIIVLSGPAWQLPAELSHDVPVLRLALPARPELGAALDRVAESLTAAGVAVELGEADRDELLDAAAGLSLAGAESAFALGAGASGIKSATVRSAKSAMIRACPGLEVWDAIPADQVGGLAVLREWLAGEVQPVMRDAVLRVRGMLLVGPPGTGKSLVSRAAASILRVPLVRLDIGGLMGSLVGESESRVRHALAVCEAVAPCVVWIDEIDSGLSGTASSGQTDGGTTARVVSTLLTWLQECSAPCTVVCTANYPERIPPAVTRPGRLDAVWCVDLPTLDERVEIASVHLVRVGVDVSGESGACLPAGLASLTADYSGAEIAAAVTAAARRTGRAVTLAALREAAGAIVPLSKSRAGELGMMREWAKANARAASAPEVAARPAPRRVTA